MNTNTIIRAQLFEYSNNPNIRGNTASNKCAIIVLEKIFTKVNRGMKSLPLIFTFGNP